jgi:nitrogen regulatory protein PII
MKKIEAIIRLSRFESIRDALAAIDVNFFTLSEVKGFGLQRGEQLTYRGSVYDADYIARLQLDIITPADKVEAIIAAIMDAGRTGKVGDGKIVVYDLDRLIRIRTGEEDEQAL